MTTNNSPAYSRLQGKKFFRLSLFACVLTAGLFTACSSDDDGNAIEAEPQAPRLITVEVSETPLEEEGAEARAGETRGDITYTSTLSGFTMYSIYNGTTSNYTVKKNGDTWPVTPSTWPGGSENNDPTPFYAFSDGTFQQTTPHIQFTALQSAFDQKDLLVASTTKSYGQCSGNLSFVFHHACAAVRFEFQLTNTLSQKLTNNRLNVTDIKLKNIKDKGKYYFEQNGWQNVEYSNPNSPTFYTISSSPINVTTELQRIPAPAEGESKSCLFIIPQPAVQQGEAAPCLEITYTLNGSNTSIINIPVEADWEAGMKYVIKVRLGTGRITV